MVRQFAEKAHTDLRVAEVLARTEGDYGDIICFHCQQAVEKMLKSGLLAAGVEPARTHDVSFLLEILGGVRPIPPWLEGICAQLADLGVAPRYPGWDAVVLRIDPREVLQSAARAVAFLDLLVASENPDVDPGGRRS